MIRARTVLKADVFYYLKKGRESAVKGSELAEILYLKNDREIRLIIRELIAEGVPIASSVYPPYGYYIVKTKEEAEDYLRVLKSRLVQDAYRRRDFKRAARAILEPEQMELL